MMVNLNDDQWCIYHTTSTYKWSLTTVNTSLMLTYHEPLMLTCHVHIAIHVPRGRVHPLRLWRSRASRPSGARMPRGDETSGATSVPRACVKTEWDGYGDDFQCFWCFFGCLMTLMFFLTILMFFNVFWWWWWWWWRMVLHLQHVTPSTPLILAIDHHRFFYVFVLEEVSRIKIMKSWLSTLIFFFIWLIGAGSLRFRGIYQISTF